MTGIEGEAGPDQGQEVEEPLGAKEQPLLAAPARRKDVLTTTSASKGKTYRPVKYDRRDAGARKRSILAQASNEKGKNTKRNTLGMGALDLFSLGHGIYEGVNGEQINLDEQTQKEKAQILNQQKDIRKT